MKLNKSKVFELIRLKNNGTTTYQVKKRIGVSIQRINQIWKEYLETEEIPLIGCKLGRPSKPITEKEIFIVRETYKKYRVSAVFLESLIEKDYKTHIPHNKIHRILLQENLAEKGDKFMPRKKNWVRYERRHSLTAVHLDWHQRPNDGCWVHIVEDDASRAILSLIECSNATTEMSIAGMKEAMNYGKIKEIITDHGSQYTENKGNAESSVFEQFLLDNNIKHILCRVKHPQSNGKVEKLFHLYERHRDSFNTKEELVHWYNNVRPHMSLDFSRLETPWQAFLRKMRK